jgi:sigma-E factor negative regulatory protein RseA
MKTELSALLDGEIERHQSRALFAAVSAQQSLRDTWADYQVIGDTLRDEPFLGRDITARVMRDLEEEPTVLAPARLPGLAWQRSALALAATVAGIAVVSWVALAPLPGAQDVPALARSGPVQAGTVAMAAPPRGMQEYLLAHQANAPGLHMQGGTQHIRTVSAHFDR